MLPEILGYVGAALVASAALNLVAQSWEDWSDTIRLLVLLTPAVLAESLGVAWIIAFLMPQALIDSRVMDPDMPSDQVAASWWARGLLLAFAAAALTIFARGGSWAWAVGGVIAAAIGALAVAGTALGWITGMLVAGVVLLALSGLLLLLRRRSSPAAATSAPER